MPSPMPNPSEEMTPGANANYSEAYSTPKKTYSDNNDNYKYHEREPPCLQQQIPDFISKDTPL